MELGILAGLLLPLIVLERTERLGREEEDCHEVDPCHNSHTDIAQLPHEATALHRGNDDSGDNTYAQSPDNQFLATVVAEVHVGMLQLVKTLGMLLVDAAAPAVEEVDEVGLCIVIVGHERGEGKEEERDGNDDTTRMCADNGTQGLGCVENAGLACGGPGVPKEVGNTAVIPHRLNDIIGLASQNHHGRGSADKEGIYIDRERLDETLFDGVRHLGGR